MLVSCNSQQPKAVTEAASEAAAAKEASFEGFDPEKLGKHVYSIEFEVKPKKVDRKIFEDGIIPWISIESPEEEIPFLVNGNEVVIETTSADLIVDYPLTNYATINIRSEGKGFTRKQLILLISREYHRIYKEEEESATQKTMPVDQRPIMNRNETNGKYGVWGHDMGDLDLSSIDVYKRPDGTLFLYLSVES